MVSTPQTPGLIATGRRQVFLIFFYNSCLDEFYFNPFWRQPGFARVTIPEYLQNTVSTVLPSADSYYDQLHSIGFQKMKHVLYTVLH